VITDDIDSGRPGKSGNGDTRAVTQLSGAPEIALPSYPAGRYKAEGDLAGRLAGIDARTDARIA